MNKGIKPTVKYLPILLFVLISYTAIGQSQTVKPYADFTYDFGMIKPSMSKSMLAEKEIEGTPYLYEEFFLGSIITKDNVLYQDIPLKYNIYNDQFEYKTREGTSSAVSNPSSISKIIMKNNTFIYAKKGDRQGFYQALNSGETQLLVRFNVVFYPSTDPTGYKLAQPARLDRASETYYLKIGDNDPVKVSKKKDLQSIFSDEDKEIMTFIKKEKINPRKKDQLIKLVEHLNELD